MFKGIREKIKEMNDEIKRREEAFVAALCKHLMQLSLDATVVTINKINTAIIIKNQRVIVKARTE